MIFHNQNDINAEVIDESLAMIYLAAHKLLFFKPKKTAGTSVEIAFSCSAGPQDIVTPILPEDEKTRYEIGGRFPQNWAWKREAEALYQVRFDHYIATGIVPARWFGWKRGRLYPRRAAKFVNHITPKLVMRRAGQAFVEDAYVVTMCRHPYETVVSWASHLCADTGRRFDHLLEKASRHRPLNEIYLFGDRRPNFVIRYEYLKQDLEVLEAKFGLSLQDRLPVTKGKARVDRRPASEILNADQKLRIRLTHRRTFEEFGYEG